VTDLSKADLARDLARLDAARGVIIAALQTQQPTPEVIAVARRRAAGHVRVLVEGQRDNPKRSP
jgi:hypothetical protein